MHLRYPFSLAVVSIAFAVFGGVFLFLRPEYHDPYPGSTIDLAKYPGASHGWTWKNGTPGFEVRTGREEWNVSRVRPHELPAGARLLNAQRNMDGLSLLVARGRCIGADVVGAMRWFCPPRLGPQVAFVVVDAIAPFGSADTYALNLVGVARGDVRRVVVRNPQRLNVVHRNNTTTVRDTESRVSSRIAGNWGTFEHSVGDAYASAPPKRPWRIRLDFYGAHHRLLASQTVAFATPGTRLVVVH